MQGLKGPEYAKVYTVGTFFSNTEVTFVTVA